jgi:site-specific DNA recombinase
VRSDLAKGSRLTLTLHRRYAIYTRQSVESPDTALSSCEVQFSLCQDFMADRGCSKDEWIGIRFDDVGESGATTDRPALKRLMQLVCCHQIIDRVVVYRLDRLTRSLKDSLQILEAMREADCELLIVTAPEVGVAATDRFVLNLMGAFAEFERDMIRSRLADSRAALSRHGRRLAGKVPLGYDADPATKQLVVNADEAVRVRGIFDLAAEGMLPTQITPVLNQRGWRTKVTVAKSSGRTNGGGPWTPRQVLAVLNNPVYIGRFAAGKSTRPGQHEAIVTPEQFAAVQEQIAAR